MSIKCIKIIEKFDEIASPRLAENWDNVGLLVGDSNANISKILVSLDATDEVIDEAVNNHVDMIITHHPIIFKGIKKINTDTVLGKKIIKLIKNDICFFCAHTNLDSASEGLSTLLANKLEIKDSKILVPSINNDEMNSCGIGRIGTINEMTLDKLCYYVKDKLELESLRVIGDLDKRIKTVSVSPGSSMEFAKEAYKMGADVFITGDIKYHDAQEFEEKGMALIDAGHFGTENIVVPMFEHYLEDCFGNDIEIISSTKSKDPFVTL